MSKETILYEIENRAQVFADIEANGWAIEHDATIDKVNGRYTNCKVVVETEPPAAPTEPTYEQLLEFYETMTGGG
jgi:hypothetical protein